MVDLKRRWCGGLGGICCGLGELQSRLSATGAVRNRGSSPSHAQGGQGEGQIVVLEGDWENDLTVSRLFCGWTWGVSYRVSSRVDCVH